MDKPTCKVNGMLAPRAMCGHVIVGLKYCGFSGYCEHKSSAEMIVNLVRRSVSPVDSSLDKPSNLLGSEVSSNQGGKDGA